MAFYNGIEEEDEDEGTGQTVGPESAALGAGAVNAEPGGSGAASKPEPFVGISQYINANKPQAEKLAGQVVSNVDGKAAGVETAIGSAQNSFNQAADSQKVEADDDLFSQVKTNATSVVGDQNKVNSFTKLRDASYSGPQSIQDMDQGNAWGGIQSAIQKAKQAKDLTNTEEGRMGLIKEISNNPRQSQGGLIFDNLLLQSDPNAAKRLQDAGASLNTVDERLAGANQTAAEKAASIKAQNQGVSQLAKGALTEGYAGLGNDLASRESMADLEQQGQVKYLKQAIQNGTLTPEMLAQLKMTAKDNTYGADLSKFINYTDTVDKYSVANQDDIARQSALKSLAGDNSLGDDFLSAARKLGEKGENFQTDLAGYGASKDANLSAYNSAMNDTSVLADIMQVPLKNLTRGPNPTTTGLAEYIKSVERRGLHDNGVTDPKKERALALKYLNEVLYPARDKIQNQFNYNETLGGPRPTTTTRNGV